jgi:GT2 family glycosyltransferase
MTQLAQTLEMPAPSSAPTTEPNVTIVVVPRERFSYSQKSLDSIYANTDSPFKLVYVDGNSPAPTQRYLQQQAKRHNFKLIRTEYFLAPNQARNIGLAAVDTPYVAFVDNDVLVTPGWLSALVNCAEETGAWAVGPMCMQGQDFKTVHVMTGTFEFRERGNKRWMIERRPFMRTVFEKVDPNHLIRQSTQLIEFHCMLVRTEAFIQIGPLDEELLSMAEESDLCLGVLAAGKEVYFEPTSVISYVYPSYVTRHDREFFLLRWSHEWCEHSVKHFCQKYDLTEDAAALHHFENFVSNHRQKIAFRQQYWLNKNIKRLKNAFSRILSKLK